MQTFTEYFYGFTLVYEAKKKDKNHRKDRPTKRLSKKSSKPLSKPIYWSDGNWTAIHYKPMTVRTER